MTAHHLLVFLAVIISVVCYIIIFTDSRCLEKKISAVEEIFDRFIARYKKE